MTTNSRKKGRGSIQNIGRGKYRVVYRRKNERVSRNVVGTKREAENVLSQLSGMSDKAFGSEKRKKDCLLYTSPSPRDQRGCGSPGWAWIK